MGLAHSPHTYTHASHPTPAPLRPLSLTPHPPLVPLLARRELNVNSLSGSLPTQLGALTALTSM